MKSVELLKTLVCFPTVSADSNLDLIHYIQGFLQNLGHRSQLIHNQSHTKANLYAVIGPADKPGVMLSGHTDVVPVAGQNWSSDPFTLRQHDNLLFGRGSCDMKGFIACVLAMVETLDASKLKTPLHLAFSYDEEIGCIGVRRLLDTLHPVEVKPRFCIVGEPTMMTPVIAHKGKTAARVHCHGVECHSSLAPTSVNAIYLATELIAYIQKLQAGIIESGPHDQDYDISHTTLHVGVIQGGTALNIVPNYCHFDFEIRNLPADDPTSIISAIERYAAKIASRFQKQHSQTKIELEIINEYPALNTATESDIVGFIKHLTGANTLGKIAFGTEGGLFSRELGIETIVYGPGSIEQAHKPDEYISLAQLDRCDAFLQKLTMALTT